MDIFFVEITFLAGRLKLRKLANMKYADDELCWFDAPLHAVHSFRYPPFDIHPEIMANTKYRIAHYIFDILLHRQIVYLKLARLTLDLDFH